MKTKLNYFQIKLRNEHSSQSVFRRMDVCVCVQIFLVWKTQNIFRWHVSVELLHFVAFVRNDFISPFKWFINVYKKVTNIKIGLAECEPEIYPNPSAHLLIVLTFVFSSNTLIVAMAEDEFSGMHGGDSRSLSLLSIAFSIPCIFSIRPHIRSLQFQYIIISFHFHIQCVRPYCVHLILTYTVDVYDMVAHFTSKWIKWISTFHCQLFRLACTTNCQKFNTNKWCLPRLVSRVCWCCSVVSFFYRQCFVAIFTYYSILWFCDVTPHHSPLRPLCLSLYTLG